MDQQLREIETAFCKRIAPAIGDVAHCTYEKRYGGEFDGPCSECAEMNQRFAFRDWRTCGASELRRYGTADAQMTVEAYCYLLCAYLTAAIREPEELDVCVDHLTYRFGPEPNDEFGQRRLAELLSVLDEVELQALLGYFLCILNRRDDWGGFATRSVANLKASLNMP